MALIANSPITLIERDNFPVPAPDGSITILPKAIVAWWHTFEFNLGWSYSYRRTGSVVWTDPEVVHGATNRVTGRHQTSMVLPLIDDLETDYEFMPVINTNPKIRH